MSEPPADVAQIRFSWPADTEISVEVYSRQTREEPDRNSDMLSEGTYTMRVAEHPEGVLVMQDDFETTRFESTPPIPESDPMWVLYNELGDLTPNYVVSPEGVLLRVEGIEDIANTVREVLQPVVDSAPDQAAGLRQMIDQMLSERVLFSQIEEQWNAMVGTWINADFEIGAEYVLEQEVPSPLLPQLSVPMRHVFSAVERTHCVEGGPEDACVFLVMESFPDEEKLAALLIEFVDRMAEGIAEPNIAFTSLHQENVILLVANPDTLLPYELETSMEVSGSITENGEETPFRRSEETHYAFSYR